MKQVVCVDDKKLLPGGNVIEGEIYEVLSSFPNSYDERVYTIKGCVNEGFSKFGMKWIGYKASRFADVTSEVAKKEEELELSLN
jgi:hypothetical protein